MIRFLRLITLSLGVFGLGSFGLANSVLSDASNYQDLQKKVDSLQDPAHTLIILDDDNTLTTMPCSDPHNLQTCQYLGGTAWGIWQSSLPLDSLARIGTNAHVYQASALIFTMSREVFTESDVPNVLDHLVKEGAHVIIETARDESMLNATEQQLNYLKGINGGSILSFIAQNTLQTPSGETSLPGAFLPCNNSQARLIRYESGMIFGAGQNKGVLLQCVLPLLDPAQVKNIKNIIFMDDTAQNDIDVVNAYAHQAQYQVFGLIYHAMDTHRDAFLTGPMAKTYQEQATKNWGIIRAAIKQSIAQPNL